MDFEPSSSGVAYDPHSSLQIPPADVLNAAPAVPSHPPSAPSRSNISGPSSQQQSSSQAGRSASVAVYSTGNGAALSPAPPQAANRKRASHNAVPSSNASQSSRSQSQGGGYPDVYSLPAAVAYAAAHPRRTIPKFGPYLLLQTLGEGEFGKVKLGLHVDYGEEVAVKLIRRGSVDNAVRFSKIEREIDVLKNLRHPNIVRLYDVIETDKYIGIIIEYASGGELFDHILAHRYLRERDAAKLFAQLISGVSYLHAKKIVHRDLKLENLLLDRNRNVIITDFGFANKFEHKADDLMQTSCGSPCYAAPELVISEGMYVGSAVDIWSCGVILYAMLAGYLPFDDDPANPDGDNINLLYKYIINTQLTFPDYVSSEARDLLSMMLVPDPARRCDLEAIKRHPWLATYIGLFEKSVEDLEHQAMEMQNAKRLQYQKMMRQREKESTSPAHVKMSRTQSARMESASGSAAMVGISSSASTRTTSTSRPQHEFLYETGGSGSADLIPPTTGRRVVASAIIPTSHAAAYDDDPFGASKPSVPSSAALQEDGSTRSRKSSKTKSPSKTSPSQPIPPPMPTSTSPTQQKKKGGYRHTLQVEYDDGEQGQAPAPVPLPIPLPAQAINGHSAVSVATHLNYEAAPSASETHFVASPLAITPPAQLLPAAEVNGADGVATPNVAVPESEPAKAEEEEDATVTVNGAGDGQDTPKKPSREPANAATPKAKTIPSAISVSPSQQQVPESLPSPTTPKGSLSKREAPSSPSPAPKPKADVSAEEETVSATSSAISVPNSQKSRTRHRKGLSLDKFNPTNLFGTGSKDGSGKPPLSGSKQPSAPPSAFAIPPTPPAASASASGTASETASTKSKASKRKTFTLMMGEQFGTAKASRDRTTSHRSITVTEPSSIAASSAPVSERPSPIEPEKPIPQTADVNGSFAHEKVNHHHAKQSFVPPQLNVDDMAGGSTGKAKKVMDWFRKRSLAKSAAAAGDSVFVPAQPPLDPHHTPIATSTTATFEASSLEQDPSTPTLDTYRTKDKTKRDSQASLTTPQVVVTAAADGQQQLPASWGPSPRSASGQSHTSTDTAASSSKAPAQAGVSTATSSSTSHHHVAKRAAEALANVAFRHPPPPPTGKRPFTPSMLRVHDGAVDQATVTTGSPPEVFEHVTKVLMSMGIEIQRESDFKYRCIRHKRKKVVGLGIKSSESAGSGLAGFAVSGSAASNGVDKRGLPIPSSNSFGATGGMLRGLLRRGSHSPAPALVTGGSPMPSPQTDVDSDHAGGLLASPILGSEPPTKEPIYGDRSVDQQDEVRFSVELTRIHRLDGTFSLDIRRLKGNLRSYKYLYDILRERALPAQ